MLDILKQWKIQHKEQVHCFLVQNSSTSKDLSIENLMKNFRQTFTEQQSLYLVVNYNTACFGIFYPSELL